MFEKPLGMRDVLPQLYERKNKIRKVIEAEIKQWGYQFIQTPMVEYYETVGSQSAINDQQMFKLLDQQGRTLVLRPDMTAPIARVASSRLNKEEIPLRLAYNGSVFRAQQREGGRPAEFEQIGVECIGDETVSADAEMITLMATSIKAAGVGDFKIAIGHIGFLNELFEQILGTEERAEQIRRFLYEKNYVGYREHVKASSLSSIDKERLLRLLQLQGGIEIIEDAYMIIENGSGKKSLEQLSQLWRILKAYGIEHKVIFDLTLVSHMSYYTGILFELYASNLGFPLGSGGRYDNLLGKFGNETVATGFGLRVDRLLEAVTEEIEEQKRYCILFTEENRQTAYERAVGERAAGHLVTLQTVDGVRDLDAYTKQFSEVIYLIGKGE